VQAVSHAEIPMKGGLLVKKTIPLWFFVLILVTSMLLTVLVTFLVTHAEVSARYQNMTTAEPIVSAPASTLFDVPRVEGVLNRLQSSWVHPIEGDLTDFLIERLMIGTGDVYSNYMNAEEYAEYNESYFGNFVGIGVSVQWDSEAREIRIVNVFPDSPADEVGFCPGDAIVAVEGDRLSFAPTDTDMLDRVGDLIRGEEGTFVNVTVRRGEEEITYRTERRAVTTPTVYTDTFEHGGVKATYVMITGFDYTTPLAFKQAVDDAEANGSEMILFDLRNNPGGLLSVVSTMLTYLVEDDALLCTTEYQKSESEVRAGGYVKEDGLSTPTLTVSENGSISYNQAYADHTLTMPCAVLINGSSASAAELFTSVLRDYKVATLVGENSFGKGCMQVTYTIAGGYALKLTVAYYTPPCGVNYDKMTAGPVGIAPDVEVIFSEEEKKQNLYAIDHRVDRQFVAAFNTLTKGEALPIPETETESQ